MNYCSTTCQKHDHKEHKEICNTMSNFKKEISSMTVEGQKLPITAGKIQDYWTEALETFIAYRCDYWSPDQTGQLYPQTYFPVAFQNYLLKEYMQRGGDIDHCNRDTAWSLLHNGAFRGELEACQLLIDKGANVNNITRGEPSHASPPLSMACKNNQPHMAEYLVNVANADIEFRDDCGVPPVFYSRPNVVILECMHCLGADINQHVGVFELNLSEKLFETYLLWNVDTGKISDDEVIAAFAWCTEHHIIQRREKLAALKTHYNDQIITPFAQLIKCGAIATYMSVEDFRRYGLENTNARRLDI